MKTLTKTLTLLLLLLTATTLYAQEPRVRPDTWARPIINTDLKNWHQVDDKVYRSAQPDGGDMKTIAAFGITEILNLRNLFSDDDEAEGTGLVLHRVKAEADDLTRDQVIQALKIIHDAKGTQLCPDCVDLFIKWCEKNPEDAIITPSASVATPGFGLRFF